jgi:hypothetical protein
MQGWLLEDLKRILEQTAWAQSERVQFPMEEFPRHKLKMGAVRRGTISQLGTSQIQLTAEL